MKLSSIAEQLTSEP